MFDGQGMVSDLRRNAAFEASSPQWSTLIITKLILLYVDYRYLCILDQSVLTPAHRGPAGSVYLRDNVRRGRVPGGADDISGSVPLNAYSPNRVKEQDLIPGLFREILGYRLHTPLDIGSRGTFNIIKQDFSAQIRFDP